MIRACLAGVLAPLVACPGAEAGELKAGAATSNITPPLGEPIVGGFEPFPSTHVHDELHARCLVLDDGATRLALVLCDNVGIAREVLDAARKMAEEATGIPADHILIASTHTHSATPARPLDRLQALDELDGYPRFLARRIADGIVRAVNNLEPAEIGWGAAEVPGQVFNRRWYVKSEEARRNPFGGVDRVRMNPPRGSDELIEPAGPTDPEVCFVSVRSADGRPIALLANYSLHYVGGVRGADISADYFAVFADRIAQKLGAEKLDPPFVGIMSNGTSGDINNVNFREPGERMRPYEKMALVAEEVAEAVHRAHESVEFRGEVTLGAAMRELTLAARVPTPEQVSYARQILAKPEDAERHHVRERNYAERVLRAAEGPKEVDVPLQALRIDELGIAAIPFEVFVETGLELKERSPFARTFTISLANGSYGYLPTPRHHELGGYETWLGTNRVEVKASDKIRDTLLELFSELKGSSE